MIKDREVEQDARDKKTNTWRVSLLFVLQPHAFPAHFRGTMASGHVHFV